MADQVGHHSEMITQLLRHMTSSPHDVDVIGEIFRRTIYPPSLVAIAFIYSQSYGVTEVGTGGGGGESAPLSVLGDQ